MEDRAVNRTEREIKRASLVSAVQDAVAATIDKSSSIMKLKAIPKDQFDFTHPMIVPFKAGSATDDCYALRLFFWDDTDDETVEIHNYHTSHQHVEAWVDELWQRWRDHDDEDE